MIEVAIAIGMGLLAVVGIGFAIWMFIMMLKDERDSLRTRRRLDRSPETLSLIRTITHAPEYSDRLSLFLKHAQNKEIR
jgi:hypothetical protein